MRRRVSEVVVGRMRRCRSDVVSRMVDTCFDGVGWCTAWLLLKIRLVLSIFGRD